MPGDADPYLIKSAAKVLDVLDLFRRSGRPMTLGDVSTRLCLPKSTVFRLLYTLEKKGCLHRIPDTYFYAIKTRPQIGMATASPWITFAAEITRGLRGAASRCGVDLLIATNEIDGMRTDPPAGASWCSRLTTPRRTGGSRCSALRARP
jgi:hypothetical protein